MRGVGLIVLFAPAVVGCSPSVTVTYSHCPVPVMLSTVDRVGGQASTPRETGRRDVLRAESSFAQTQQQSGNFTYVSTTISGPMSLTLDALKLVPNQADVDASNIQVDGVSAGSFVMPGYTKIWGEPQGRKVWVK
jgi:hypothetical protein